MRILIISDIHANITALNAVLELAGSFDAVWCLGDLVGYGPDPNACIEKIRSLPNLTCILGNHDAATLNHIDTTNFNPEAREAIFWTQNQLSESNVAFLKNLPEKVVVEGITLAHGSPRHPVWEYLLDNRTARHSFDYFDTDYCLVGHTHLPVIYTLIDDHNPARLMVPEPNTSLTLKPRAIINPGSVGQPRDRDPRAAFAIFEPQLATWEYRRVAYDINDVQARMLAAGLPGRHVVRLAAGW
jgi:predicted phosphodiesterase